MAAGAPGVIPYGYQGVAWDYAQYLKNEQQRGEQEAEADARYQASLDAQLAGQRYQNQAMGINNANDLARAQQQQAALGLNFAGDMQQRQMALMRGQGDIAQLMARNRDAANRGKMDIAQFQYGVHQQQLGAEEDLARTAYQRGTHEVTSDWDRYKRSYGFS